MDTPIIDSIDPKLIDNLVSVSDRYYQHKYCLSLKNIEENIHQRVSFHSNRLCLLSLASDHPVMRPGKTIKRINFDVDSKKNNQRKVVGKSKKGAQKLEPHSIVCNIEMYDGEIYPVYACVKGKLIEVNEQIQNDANLIRTHPVSMGYLALILPDLKYFEKSKEEMLTKAEYLEAIYKNMAPI